MTLPEIETPRTVADARFTSALERRLADLFEPLGLRVDRSLGIAIGDVHLQPSFAVMPLCPADHEAEWHRDFVGVVQVVGDLSDAACLFEVCPDAPSCRFVLALARDGLGTEVAMVEEDWSRRALPADGRVRLADVDVDVAALRP